jgi:hypothetical protein
VDPQHITKSLLKNHTFIRYNHYRLSNSLAARAVPVYLYTKFYFLYYIKKHHYHPSDQELHSGNRTLGFSFPHHQHHVPFSVDLSSLKYENEGTKCEKFDNFLSIASERFYTLAAFV